MPLYEHVFLARQDASPQQVEDITTQITGVITQLGGKVTKTEQWGLRSLSYRMDKNRKAHFVMLNIDGPTAIVAEIERQERINEEVLRYSVPSRTRGSSAMTRSDRDSAAARAASAAIEDARFRGGDRATAMTVARAAIGVRRRA